MSKVEYTNLIKFTHMNTPILLRFHTKNGVINFLIVQNIWFIVVVLEKIRNIVFFKEFGNRGLLRII